MQLLDGHKFEEVIVTLTQNLAYEYDAFDRRIAKKIDWDLDGGFETQERFVYDGDDIALVFGGYDDLQKRYLHGPGTDEVLAEEDVSTGARLWMLADQLGSIRDVASDAGVVLDHVVYNAFGAPASQTDWNYSPRYGFAGREFDGETFQYFNRARYYDMYTGRFLSQDPWGFGGQDDNLYRYATNRPTTLKDPFGLWVWPWDSTASWQVSRTSSLWLGNDHPVTVGTQWLTGEGPRNREFREGDQFTEMLKSHDHIQQSLDQMTQKISSGDPSAFTPAGQQYGYDLGGIQGVGKYIKDYSTLLTFGQTGNLAVTYLGSYGMSIQPVSIDYGKGEAWVQIDVNNSSSLASATRPPVLGYTDWWQRNVSPEINKLLKDGPLSKTTQHLKWFQKVTFTPDPTRTTWVNSQSITDPEYQQVFKEMQKQASPPDSGRGSSSGSGGGGGGGGSSGLK